MRLELDPNATSVPTQVEQSGEIRANDSSVLLKKGISAAQAGDRELARRLLNEAVQADAACSDAWMWLASIAEYPEELLACLDHVLEVEPDNARALEWRVATMELLAKTFVQRGVAAHETGDDAGAVDLFDKALSHDRECENAWLWKGKLAVEDDMKVEFLRRVLSINPENADASAILREVVESRLEARLIEAKKAAIAGNNTEALEMLEQVLDKDSRNIEAWMLRSHLSNDVSDKLHSLETVLIIDPDHAAARAGYDFLASAISVVPEEPAVEEPIMEIEVEAAPEPAIETAEDVEQFDQPEMNDMIDPFKTIVGLNSDEIMEAAQSVLEAPAEEYLAVMDVPAEEYSAVLEAPAEEYSDVLEAPAEEYSDVLEAPAVEYSDVLDATEIMEETEADEYVASSTPDILQPVNEIDQHAAAAEVWPVEEGIQEVEVEPWAAAADEEAVAEVFEMAQEAYEEQPVAADEEPWVQADEQPVAAADEPWVEADPRLS